MSPPSASELVAEWCRIADELSEAFEHADHDSITALLEQRQALVQQASHLQSPASEVEREAVADAEERIADASESALRRMKEELEGVATVSRAIGRYSSNQR